jgi:hypothetical protein
MGLSVWFSKTECLRRLFADRTYNFAHDIALPGSQRATLGFLMYAQAETNEGRLDSLDPDHFKYEIKSGEIRL